MAAIVWKGFVSFGLVSFPIRLYAAARNKGIRFHLLHKKDLSRVKEVFYCETEDRPLERSEIVKGYEVSKDHYVVVDDDEIKSIAPPTAKIIEIVQFVKADELNPVFLDKSYHVTPDGAVEKPYALLLEAMKKRDRFAVAKLAMHNREHLVVLRPDGRELMLHTMFFHDEIQQAPAQTTLPRFSAKELQLAGQLVDALTQPFKAEQFRDNYQANLQKLIDQKRKGKAVTGTKQPEPKKVVDIMEALQKSLAERSGKSARVKPSSKRTRKTA